MSLQLTDADRACIEAETTAALRAARAAGNRRYYEANKDKVADYQRRYYEANKDKVADYQRRYYEANKERLQAHNRDYMRKRRAAQKAGA